MDDLTALVAQLEQEHAGLAARVQQQDDERRHQLETQTTRLERAEVRCAAANYALEHLASEHRALERRRDDLQARVRGLAGRFWMTGYTTAAMAAFITSAAAMPLLVHWRSGDLVLWQAGLLIAGLLLIPRRS